MPRKLRRSVAAAVACSALTAAALPAPVAAATHCGTAHTTKALVYYTLTLSVPRCYDGRRVRVTGAPVVTADLTVVGLAYGYSPRGVASAPPVAYRAAGGRSRGMAIVTRVVRFHHCLDDPRLGCTLDLGYETERITLRLFASGRSSGS